MLKLKVRQAAHAPDTQTRKRQGRALIFMTQSIDSYVSIKGNWKYKSDVEWSFTTAKGESKVFVILLWKAPAGCFFETTVRVTEDEETRYYCHAERINLRENLRFMLEVYRFINHPQQQSSRPRKREGEGEEGNEVQGSRISFFSLFNVNWLPPNLMLLWESAFYYIILPHNHCLHPRFSWSSAPAD